MAFIFFKYETSKIVKVTVQSQKNWLEHLNRDNKQSLNFWLSTKSSMSTLNLTKYENSHCLRFPCGGGLELKFFTDLIVLSSIIGKEKYVASVLYNYLFGMFYFCLKICQYISSQFVEVTPPKTLNVASWETAVI